MIRGAFVIFVLFCILVAFIICCSGDEEKGRASDGDNRDDSDDETSENVPEAPTELQTLAEPYAVWLFWRDNSDNEQGFRIYFRDAELEDWPFAKLVELGADTEQFYYFVGPEQNLEYYVVAFNEYGESEPSNTDNAKTRPNDPQITHIECQCGLSKGCEIIVGWNDSHVEDGYKVKVNNKEYCDCVEGCKPCICSRDGEERYYFGCYVAMGMFFPGTYGAEVVVYNDVGEFSSFSPVTCTPASK